MRLHRAASMVGCVALSAASAGAQTSRPAAPPVGPVTSVSGGAQHRDPIPEGQRIQAADGDLVVLDDDARLRVVRRRSGVVRLIYNEAQHWALLLVDFDRAGTAGDGRVDWHYQFYDIDPQAPLPARWEGPAGLEEYTVVGEGQRLQSLGIRLPTGLVQFVPPGDRLTASTEKAAQTVSYRGSGFGGDAATFDAAEQQQLAVVARNVENRGTGARMISQTGGGVAAVRGAVTLSSPAAESGTAPVRVGGSIAAPRRLADAAPVYPDQARQAGISGVVILEITIDAAGAVSNARVLRSIPLLDQAAIDAARQWRYEPTLLNGRAVPIILTATVDFR